ncbi:MAG TPA: ABC transporter permease [Ktedonobacterales bacterium]|jgi:peptide/nickel transport system permease protein|nr:ABC transporter permease [Ktedonobacterales bacterium]
MTLLDSVEIQPTNPPHTRPKKKAKLMRFSLPRSGAMRLGFGILAFFIVVALIGPLLLPGDPNTSTPFGNLPPSPEHWLGTTTIGQDIFRQLVDGTRLSVLIGFTCGLLTTLVAIIIGVAGGYFGGWIDEFLSMISNVFLVIPQLPLIIVLAALVPSGRGPGTVIIVITVTGWAWGARVLRSITLTLRQRDYVQAARVGGESTFRLIFFEIVPNMGAIIATNFIFATISAILTEATLEFLGLSNLNQVSWGTMLYWAQNNDALLGGHWSWYVPPGICIALLCTSLALINYGIDSIVNPRLRSIPTEKPAGLSGLVARLPLLFPKKYARRMVQQHGE